MQQNKLLFFKDVIHLIHDLSKLVFNLHSENDIERVYGMSETQIESVINRIINALPESLFNPEHVKAMNEMKGIFAKEFIFFQLQEKPNDQSYETDLSGFIDTFSRDMQARFKSSIEKGEVK